MMAEERKKELESYIMSEENFALSYSYFPEAIFSRVGSPDDLFFQSIFKRRDKLPEYIKWCKVKYRKYDLEEAQLQLKENERMHELLMKKVEHLQKQIKELEHGSKSNITNQESESKVQ